MVFLVMKETGMSWYEIMWQRSWINVQMILADAPRLEETPKENTTSGKDLAARINTKYKRKRNG